MTQAMDMLSRIAFGLASLVLIVLSLMLVVFGAVGVVAGIIAVEKTVPWRRVAHGTAAVLLALGVLLLIAPNAIPGLTTPGHNQMDQMTLASS